MSNVNSKPKSCHVNNISEEKFSLVTGKDKNNKTCNQSNFTRKEMYKIKRSQRRIMNKMNLSKSCTMSDLPTIAVQLNNKLPTVSALIDSGACLNAISETLYNNLCKRKLVISMNNREASCISANNSTIRILGECIVKIKIRNFSWYVKFSVIQKLTCEMILGSTFIRETGMLLDLSRNSCYFRFNPKVRIFLVGKGKNAVCLSNLNSREQRLNTGCEDMKPFVEHLSKKYSNVFTTDIGKALNFEFKIQLKDNEIVNQRPYPVHPTKMVQMKEILSDLLKQNIIRPSISSYSSPSFLVSKPDKSSRLVINYAKLNEKIVRVNYPLGNLDEFYQYLQNADVFSVIDLSNSFMQIPLSEESKHLTAFSNGVSLFEFNRIPYGLHCGSGLLSAYLDNIFRDVKFDYVLNFVDDILVFSKNKEEHMKHVTEVLDRLSRHNLTVNPKKVKLFYNEISYLGNIISKNQIRVDPDRTIAVRNFNTPKNCKEVGTFVGMINYFSKYIKDYSKIAAPLNELRKKRVKFQWTKECQESFCKLKEAITNPPVLAIPDFRKPFYLFTDAAQNGAGSTLLQCNDDGDKVPVAYYSKKFTPSEVNMSVYEKEAYSVFLAIKKFYMYLEIQPFYLITDNSALSWVLAHYNKLNKLSRWVEQIIALPFKVFHVKSKDNPVSDALSRLNMSDNGIEVIEVDSDPRQISVVKCKSKKKFSSVSKKQIKPVLNIISDIPLAYVNISEHQKLDPECAEILQSVKNKTNKDNFYIKNDMLMFCKPGSKTGRIYVPSSLVDMLFSYYHTSNFGGHQGQNRTVHKVLEYFYRPNLISEIRKRVKNCQICIKAKPPQQRFQGELVSGLSQQPLDCLYIDTAGPLVRSKFGNRHILIVVDAFTKYVWLIPVRDITAQTIVTKLENVIFNNFSSCKRLVSDNGSCFRSVLFKKLMFKYSIEHHRLIPYRANPNISERFLRNVKQQIRAYHHDAQNSWCVDLKFIQISLNTSLCETTKCTAFELMFHHKPNHSLSNLWKLNDLLNVELSQEEVKEKFSQAIRNCKRAVAHNKNRQRYKDNRTKHPFKIGSIVYLENQTLSKKIDNYQAKMDFKYTGPYKIIYFMSPVSVLIQLEGNPEVVKRAHISQLKIHNKP